MEDPRWGAQGRSSPASNSFSQQGDGQGGGAFSIVFSAHWVRTTAPIGEGAFSRVYEGIYTNPETCEESVVAIKILKRNMLKRRSDCLRFIKEAKIMTKISHPNIAACYGIGKYDDDDPQNPGSLFIVQELIKGGNLLHRVYKQMLNRQKCVYTSQEALSWLINVADGMLYLHAAADGKPMIIHRDLKLENIMLCPLGGSAIMAKLVDFGLHKVIDDRIKKVVKRVISEVNLGNRMSRGRQMAQEPEVDEDDELEVALAERGLHAHIEEGEEGEEDELEAAQQEMAAKDQAREQAHQLKNQELAQGAANGEDGGALTANPVHKVRSLPKRTSSMQKLMAKMKEIKLRVTGKNEEGGVTPGALPANGTTSRLGNATPSGPLSTGPTSEASEAESKQVRNEALLNRIIAEQSTAAAEKQQMLDDLGIMDGAAGQQRRKAPPRRAVTWVNEVRYNLTEAVGSWAYMAPEVVLGQPYNEKVDVFSFGVILFEVLNRKLMLVDEIKNDPRKDAQAYAERVARGFRPEIPKRWPSQLTELIESCWAQDPHLRPNFVAVVDMLREVERSGVVSRLDVAYWSQGSAFV